MTDSRPPRSKTDIERWVETAADQVHQRPRNRHTWMLERQIAIIADVVRLYRDAEGATRH